MPTKKWNRQILISLLLLLLALTIVGSVFQNNPQNNTYIYPLFNVAQAEGANSPTIGEGCFSLFHISDTQTLTTKTSKTYLFDQQCQWIANNSAYFNNEMVIHTGDIQDDGDIADQWIRANDSINILMNNSIPYVWCAGNHDLHPIHSANRPWRGDQYAAFNPANFIDQTYWVSNFSEGKNTASKFDYENNDKKYNFLVVMVEYDGNDTVLTWMKDLIKNYPDYNVIVGTHDYMNTNGEYTSYGIKLSAILDTLPNVVMVICGHTHSSNDPSQTSHKTVNGREEIEWDLQEYDLGGIGSADVQILTFNVTGVKPIVSVFTFQTYKPTQYLMNIGQTYNFTLTLNSEPETIFRPTNMVTPSLSPSTSSTPLTSNSQSATINHSAPKNQSLVLAVVVATIILIVLLLACEIVRVRKKRNSLNNIAIT